MVLDTLNKSLIGSESKDVDMSAYLRAAEAIRDAFGCVVIIVHHCGPDDQTTRSYLTAGRGGCPDCGRSRGEYCYRHGRAYAGRTGGDVRNLRCQEC